MEEKNKDIKDENKKVETKNDIKKEETKFKKADKKETKKLTKEANKKEKKNDGGKKKAWIPTVIAVVIVLLIAGILTTMIITSSAPKKSLDSLLTNLKAGDFEKAQQYLDEAIDFATEDLDGEAQRLLFDKLEWKIGKVTENEEGTASIEVEITTKDFKTIVNNYMQKALEAVKGAITGGGSTESFSSQDFEKYFIDELKNEEIQTTTINTTINAIKQDRSWKIVSGEELVNALLPGLNETINSLS